jgi:L-amino acid N-acyltransferase YncA
MSDYSIREARLSDLETLVEFTRQEAREAEGEELELASVRRGVRAGLEDPGVASYWVAETADGRIVASTSVITEWSDWRGADYWWVQSLFIVPEHRGRRLVELLLDRLAQAAREAGALDLRLYAHRSNRRALAAYRRCGFITAPYTILTRKLEEDRRKLES